jgi:hypothetical protein
MQMLYGCVNVPIELALTAGRSYGDIFYDAEPDGFWCLPNKPNMADWLLVLEDKEALARIV